MPTPESEAVRRYFDAQAPDYTEASARWPWSWVRAREAHAVLAALGQVEGHTVWDVGCGAGFYTRQVLRRGAEEVVAVDGAPRMLEQLHHPRVRTILGDAARVDPGGRFDRIVCAGMLEFVDDPRSVLAHLSRHAAKDAVLALLVPAKNTLSRLYSRFHRSHGLEVHRFTPSALERVAHDAGWQTIWTRSVAPFALVARLEPA